jgi:hypothetical protein
MIFECDGNRGLVQSTGCTFSIPNYVGLVNSSLNNYHKTSLRGLNSAESSSGVLNPNQTSLNQNQTQIITGTNIDLNVDKPVDESVTATTHVNSRYLHYKEPLSYKQAMTFSVSIFPASYRAHFSVPHCDPAIAACQARVHDARDSTQNETMSVSVKKIITDMREQISTTSRGKYGLVEAT